MLCSIRSLWPIRNIPAKLHFLMTSDLGTTFTIKTWRIITQHCTMKNEFDIQMPNTQYLEGQTPSRCKQMNIFFSWFALLATGSEQFPRRTAHCSLLPLEALCEFESLIVITKIQGASGPSNNHHGRSLVIPCPIYNGGWMKLNGRKNEIWSDLMGG